MSCVACDQCETGCGKVVTPAGLLCRSCASALASEMNGTVE